MGASVGRRRVAMEAVIGHRDGEMMKFASLSRGALSGTGLGRKKAYEECDQSD